MGLPRTFLALAVLFVACAYGGAAPRSPKVVGYFPAWRGDPAAVDYGRLTHIAYAFVLPSDAGDGSLKALREPRKLDRIVAAAHAKGVKVLISVGGWQEGKNPGFERLAASRAARSRFARALLGLVAAHGLDGVDIDWEYPEGGDNPANFAVLMRELGAALHAKGLLLTAAVPALGRDADAILPDVFGSVDFLNLMAYDGDKGAGHSPMKLAEDCLAYWLGRGVPPEKAVLGVPFYGRPGYQAYAEIVAAGGDPWRDEHGGEHYNGLATIRAKTRLALAKGGGVMIWELSQDLPGEDSLLSAIRDEMHRAAK